MSLKKIAKKSKRIKQPKSFLLGNGNSGVGKTTFASKNDKKIFILTEEEA